LKRCLGRFAPAKQVLLTGANARRAAPDGTAFPILCHPSLPVPLDILVLEILDHVVAQQANAHWDYPMPAADNTLIPILRDRLCVADVSPMRPILQTVRMTETDRKQAFHACPNS